VVVCVVGCVALARRGGGVFHLGDVQKRDNQR